MTREDFERRITDLLPDVSDQAMKNWLEYAENLDRDGTETESEIFDRSFVELALIKRHQGMETAAAQYLSLGGSLDHVPALALVGFLMEPQNHDSMLRAVKHMNDGGDAASAYYAAEGEVFKDHSPQCQQTM
ncbi:MAG: hypothetical protein ACLUES_15535 [Flavonifractor plautii]